MRCRSSSTLPAESLRALEKWAESASIRDAPVLLDDISHVSELAALPLDRALPLCSLAAAPLVYRGRTTGVLVGLANSRAGFLPHDVKPLQLYAAQAAIAIENARLYEAQQQLASRDPLTGLLNHREFHEAVARELDVCRRHGGSMAVVLLDLDDFKQVNDTSGHAAGDSVLRALADALRTASRSSDQAFRIGGDEFALVLPRSSARDAVPVAERAAGVMTGVDTRRRRPRPQVERPGR
jgi:diguanylate cyclase (GGDEF)-like protein